MKSFLKRTRFFLQVGLLSLCAVILFAPPAKAALTETQIQSVLTLLTAFNVDAPTLVNVSNTLHGIPSATTSPTLPASNAPVITRTLSLGLKGDDVLSLQQYFIAQGLLSAGSATGFFGPLTQAAVQKLQAQNNLVSSGTPSSTGWGVVGPKTRALITKTWGSTGGSSGTTGPSTPPAPTTPNTTPGSTSTSTSNNSPVVVGGGGGAGGSSSSGSSSGGGSSGSNTTTWGPSLSAKLPDGRQRAFPTAEGFGAGAKGGRGGSVIYVTNLNDSGAGSLRACIDATGPRTCIFRIGGTITLVTPLIVKNPFLTIAGESAPGGGIALKNAVGNPESPLQTNASDLIIRNIRLRPGPGASGCCLNTLGILDGTHDAMFDHLSGSWGVDQNIVSWKNTGDYTIQWSIFSEPLLDGPHSTPGHQGNRARDVHLEWSSSVSFHHNLLAHATLRNPLFIPAGGIQDIVNNVLYDVSTSQVMLSDEHGDAWANLEGNFALDGPKSIDARKNNPATILSSYLLDLINDGPVSHSRQVFAQNNYSEPYLTNPSAPSSGAVASNQTQYLVGSRFTVPQVKITSPIEAYNAVLLTAGATKPLRDTTDTRIVQEARARTGTFVLTDPNEVGGWPVLASGTPYPDSDQDGISDAWETAHGLNPNNAADGNADRNNDGWTNLEEFLSEMAGDNAIDPSAPAITFSANPVSISAGGSANLTWSVANATTCTASGGWSGSKATSGSQSVTPSKNSTYTLTCTGAGGSATYSTTVAIAIIPPVPPTTQFSIGNPIQTTATLNVRSFGGSSGVLLGTQPAGVLGTIVAGPSISNNNFWWQIDFDTGVDGWSVETLFSKVAGTPAATPAPTVSLSASPTSIISGQSSTLTWSSTDATSCTASNGWSGALGTSGSQTISPTATTTYTLACSGTGGIASSDATVNVARIIAVGARIRIAPTFDPRITGGSATSTGTQPVGATGTIISGPFITGSGTNPWWQIDFDTGPDGWVNKSYLIVL